MKIPRAFLCGTAWPPPPSSSISASRVRRIVSLDRPENGPAATTNRQDAGFRVNAPATPISTSLTSPLRRWCPLDVTILTWIAVWGAYSSDGATLHVRWDSPKPTPPYATWDTAATQIQQAVAAADPGDTIIVTNGIYREGVVETAGEGKSRVALTNRAILRSLNGPAATVIEGGTNRLRCVYVGDQSVLSGFTLTGGTAFVGGGALCAVGGVLTNCILSGNSAEYNGGGVSGGTLDNCTISRNSTASEGGGVSGSTLYGCTVTGNSATSSGGGVFEGTLYNCTVTGNSADWGGGIAYGRLYNCIAYFNRARVAEDNYIPGDQESGRWGDKTVFEFSCTSPLPPGPGNIDVDPGLSTATHLSLDSPCVGTGSAIYTRGFDVDGQSWATPPAMGADEPRLTTDIPTLRIEAGTTTVATRHPIAFVASGGGALLRSVWDFGDGSKRTNEPCVKHSWGTPGVYQVQLIGYSQSHPEGIAAILPIRVAEPEVFYVSANNVHPQFPYADWDTAATNIQDAVQAGSQPGRRVIVTNGVYRFGATEARGLNRVALTNEVVLLSVNGPERTVIEGNSPNVRCVYAGDDCMVSGFTLTGGGSWMGGGGARCQRDGVLTNCFLVENLVIGQVAWGGGVYGGKLYDCLIRGNSVHGNWTYGGGAYRSTLERCTLIENSSLYSDGGGAYESTLYHCVLSGNRAGVGGGASQCQLYHCALSGNLSQIGAGASASELHNCLLAGNSAEAIGGGASQCTLHDCTITDNSAGLGGGIYSGMADNCVVYFNHAPEGSNHSPVPDSESTVLRYSCTTPLPDGPGNIDSDPRFVNPAASDFRLRPSSPCIDAGTSRSDLPLTDYAGGPRILDGNEDGLVRMDMGAFEFDPTVPFISRSAVTSDGLRLEWLRSARGAQLQRSRGLSTPDWQDVPGSVGTNAMTLPIGGATEFFRLVR